MDMNTYQLGAARTASTMEDQAKQIFGLLSFKELSPVEYALVKEVCAQLAPHWRLMVSALGLAGEAGEYADLVKKMYGHGKKVSTETLTNELGDVGWYYADNATQLGVKLGPDVAAPNLRKLMVRYPEKFSVAASEARVDVQKDSRNTY